MLYNKAFDSFAIFLTGSQLFVHGGRNNFVLEDMFVLDLAKKEWTDVAPGAHTPPPRHCHLMTVHADKLYMYGGYDELGAWSDAMFCLPVPYDQPFTPARYAFSFFCLSLIGNLKEICLNSSRKKDKKRLLGIAAGKLEVLKLEVLKLLYC